VLPLAFDGSKWIVNLSGKNVPDNILSFLSLGSNFALPFIHDCNHDCREFVVDVIKSF